MGSTSTGWQDLRIDIQRDNSFEDTITDASMNGPTTVVAANGTVQLGTMANLTAGILQVWVRRDGSDDSLSALYAISYRTDFFSADLLNTSNNGGTTPGIAVSEVNGNLVLTATSTTGSNSEVQAAFYGLSR